MGFFKKLFGGKTESDKAQEEVKELAQKAAQQQMQGILEKIAKQENSKNVATDSTSNDDLIKIVIDNYDERSLIIIASCANDDEDWNFMDLWDEATLKGKPYFYYPKEKWEKALAEKEKRMQEEQQLFTTASLNNKGIELEKNGDIESAIITYEENVKLGYPARHQYDRLIILYHKNKDYENEKRILNKAIELFPDETTYKKKLAKLNGLFEIKVITSAPKDVRATDNWGEIWEERILEVPEFDFYYEQETNPDKYDLKFGEVLNPIWEVQSHFRMMESEAKAAEDMGEQDVAVRLYEQMVADRYFMPSPYDRLIKIYSMAKLHDEEIRILKIGIPHFKQLREKRKAYVMHLAQKYNAVDFANERINNGKKITYYGGAFELYNPFPIVERWEARLQKLLSKKTNNR